MPQTPQAPTLISAAFFGIFGHGTLRMTGCGAGPVIGAYANLFHGKFLRPLIISVDLLMRWWASSKPM